MRTHEDAESIGSQMKIKRAWKALKSRLGETVWLRHVKGHSGHGWNDLVDRYADMGRQGGYRYDETTTT